MVFVEITWMVFNSLTLSVLEKLKISIFEIPKFPGKLNINNQKDRIGKYINLYPIRGLIECSSIITHFKILLLEDDLPSRWNRVKEMML